MTQHTLRLEPWWRPLHGHPRFEALLSNEDLSTENPGRGQSPSEEVVAAMRRQRRLEEIVAERAVVALL